MIFLIDAANIQMEKWLTMGLWTSEMPRSAWVAGLQGELYMRYFPGWGEPRGRLDLATFQIAEEYQRKGVAKSIIELACRKTFDCVRIDNIMNMDWAPKVAAYSFPGRVTRVSGDEEHCLTVDFKKAEIVDYAGVAERQTRKT